MAELIDISNEKFWDILFDEACVEGQQAKRIDTALKQIATTEAEIRASVIDEALKALSIFNDREHGNEHFIYGIETAKEILEQLKEREQI